MSIVVKCPSRQHKSSRTNWFQRQTLEIKANQNQTSYSCWLLRSVLILPLNPLKPQVCVFFWSRLKKNWWLNSLVEGPPLSQLCWYVCKAIPQNESMKWIRKLNETNVLEVSRNHECLSFQGTLQKNCTGKPVYFYIAKKMQLWNMSCS